MKRESRRTSVDVVLLMSCHPSRNSAETFLYRMYQGKSAVQHRYQAITEKTGLLGVLFFDNLSIFPVSIPKPTAVSSFIEIVQAAKEFFIIRFFTDGIDA